jgi:hypothetical protein
MSGKHGEPRYSQRRALPMLRFYVSPPGESNIFSDFQVHRVSQMLRALRHLFIPYPRPRTQENKVEQGPAHFQMNEIIRFSGSHPGF